MKNFVVLLAVILSLTAKADFYSATNAYQNKNYTKAFTEFRALAELGDIESQANLGVMYFYGQGVKKDVEKAYAWIKLASQGETAAEKYREMLTSVKAQLTDLDGAEKLYDELYARYSSEALMKSLYPVITAVKSDKDMQAVPIKIVPPKYPQKAVARGIRGWVKVAFDLDENGKARNIRVLESMPADTFERAALKAVSRWKFEPVRDEQGKPTTSMDVRYTMEFRFKGQPLINPDYLAQVRQKAENGDPKAEYVFGYLQRFLDEENKSKNPNYWYLRAASKGLPLAQYEIGSNLIRGSGCEKDKKKGIEWLVRAATSGVSDAKDLLAALALQDDSKEAQLRVLNLFDSNKNLTANSKIRLAWLLATSPYDEVADPRRAIALVEDLTRREFWDEVTKQEILAAAYARLGDFEEAVDYQEEALEDAEDYGFYLPDIKQRLDVYRQRELWF